MAADNILRITKAGFSEEGYGTFDSRTQTATLTRCCEKTISIESNGITLTSNGARVEAATQNGIRLVNVSNIRIHNIEIHHSKMGIYAGTGRNIDIDEVGIFECTYGISFEQLDGLTVSDCRCKGMMQEAISGERSSNLLVRNLQSEWSPQGIVIHGSKNILLENNLITTELFSCIAVANCLNLTIKDNTLFGGEHTGCLYSERPGQTNEARRYKMSLMNEI